MSDIRRDRLHDHYVLIAPERMRRLDTLNVTPGAVPESSCPFCQGHESMTPPEIYAFRTKQTDISSWSVRVVPNLYKAVQIELGDESRVEGMFESRPGVGAHEILIDTPCHSCRMSQMDIDNIIEWLNAISNRVSDLRKDKRLIYLSVFKNQGESAGATQSHPHTQLIALPIMPHETLRLMERDLQYYRRHGRGKVEDLLENELLEGTRIVARKGIFVAFCPYASSYPFEVIIVPRKALMTLDQLNRDEIFQLATLTKEVMQRLDIELGDYDFNMAFNMAPLNSNFENEPYFPHLKKYYRMTIRIMPRIYRLGGFELSTGLLINPVTPEEAAQLLREAKI